MLKIQKLVELTSYEVEKLKRKKKNVGSTSTHTVADETSPPSKRPRANVVPHSTLPSKPITLDNSSDLLPKGRVGLSTTWVESVGLDGSVELPDLEISNMPTPALVSTEEHPTFRTTAQSEDFSEEPACPLVWKGLQKKMIENLLSLTDPEALVSKFQVVRSEAIIGQVALRFNNHIRADELQAAKDATEDNVALVEKKVITLEAELKTIKNKVNVTEEKIKIAKDKANVTEKKAKSAEDKAKAIEDKVNVYKEKAKTTEARASTALSKWATLGNKLKSVEQELAAMKAELSDLKECEAAASIHTRSSKDKLGEVTTLKAFMTKSMASTKALVYEQTSLARWQKAKRDQLYASRAQVVRDGAIVDLDDKDEPKISIELSNLDVGSTGEDELSH
ncbi:hypothetical protein L6164_016594 [Bauhinia variegata]|nr:hypothetical protein L6164_016594 [Bauhinia variegata]